MKIRIGIMIAVAISSFAMAQESSGASRFLVYNISSLLAGVGKEFAEEQFVDLGEERNVWRGQLIIDTEGAAQTGRLEGAIIWSTRKAGEPVMQVVTLTGGLLSQTISQSIVNSNLIYALSTARNRGNLPDSETLSHLFLEGSRARQVDIGAGDTELASSVLRGQFYLLDSTTESYRWGRLSARLNYRQTRDANVLGDFERPYDSIVDYRDVVAFYQDQLRNLGYRAITE